MHFFVWQLKTIKRYAIIVLLALVCALFLWIGQFNSLSVFSSENGPEALSKGDDKQAAVALTFNISWGTEKVNAVLKQLADHDVQATFFVSGEWAERHPELMKKINEGEHEIGMMGYRYTSYLEQQPEQIRKDLNYAKEIFDKLGYEDLTLLRPPHGHFNKEVLEIADEKGYDVVQWSVNPRDWENPGTEQIVDHVMSKSSKGDIILLHASDSAKQTPKALDTILPGLKGKGLKFVRVTDMVAGSEANAQEIN
ncbi:putative polysaccharide deacetylase PdaB [Thalassobacillus devorans]|uniref:Polysaccharide deacetylase PdaB n=1 Tax=Thalassobacillus devorans TaxID=279813 RepID=A0ABQ1PTN0_9BACI|nr:polysaccharide deacetylase family sporulation protein PdaB [Thalassobacillus devorans]NIK30772.1 polysaccharide deacetylase family sporulation protein PdaB [Thalassobacillus devorans]GGD03146.1 putative polysaccharide deacetylase PdaB [Thalassobacillus devorans]